jgi:multidrug efflux pump subunit AcrB
LPGVVEVNSFGGHVKQYEVAINPDKLRSMNITMSEVFDALNKNNQNTGGAYIEKNYQANFIRGEGLMRSKKDIQNTNDFIDKINKINNSKPNNNLLKLGMAGLGAGALGAGALAYANSQKKK